MIRGSLPPAGDAVIVRPEPRALPGLLARWQPYRPSFYASGTAALAAGLSALIRRAGVREPQVILPAYGCPALVSAVLHAGAMPVYADLEPDRPWMSLESLRRLIGPSTAAVVAVNFLGIPERLASIRELLAGTPAGLIEDSAQAFCNGSPDSTADMVVLSFGRGKPVSLLGGGALLCRDQALASLLPRPPAPAGSLPRLRLKATAYNVLRKPSLYWLPQSLPLGLGETRFEALTELAAMDAERETLLPAAVAAYLRQGQPAAKQLRAVLAAPGPLLDLAAVCGLPADARLSRYPVLARDAAGRDELLAELGRRGLGASKMYGVPLPQVQSVPVATANPLPAAMDFADRLLTLPVHDGVAERHVRDISAVLRRYQSGIVRELPRLEENEEAT